jgi:hypothetical protein
MNDKIETIKETLRMIRGTLQVFWRMAKEDFDMIEDKSRFIVSGVLALAGAFAVYYFIVMPLAQVI